MGRTVRGNGEGQDTDGQLVTAYCFCHSIKEADGNCCRRGMELRTRGLGSVLRGYVWGLGAPGEASAGQARKNTL